jgi:hypothetical protein
MSDAYTQLVDPYWRYGPGDPFSRPPLPNMPIGAAGLSVFGALKATLDMKANIDSAVDRIAFNYAVQTIREQLAPGQRVDATIVREGPADYRVVSVSEARSGSTIRAADGLAPGKPVGTVTISGPPAQQCYVPGQEPRNEVKVPANMQPPGGTHIDRPSSGSSPEAKAPPTARETQFERPIERDARAEVRDTTPFKADTSPADRYHDPIERPGGSQTYVA